MTEITELIKITKRNNLEEGFEGIRKDNSRIIFGILLLIIISDFIYTCID